MGSAIVFLINSIIGLVIWAVIIQAVLSWLVAFDVINLRNRFVYQLMHFLEAVVSPLLRPFQKVIPSLGGVDITPILLILVLQALKIAFNSLLAPTLIGIMG
jgi:YggT family protein